MAKNQLNGKNALIVVKAAEKDTIEFAELSDGQLGLSVRGLAGALGVKSSTLQRTFNTDTLERTELGKHLARQGFNCDSICTYVQWKNKPYTFIPEDVVMTALEFYSLEAGRHCTRRAKATYRLLARKSFHDFARMVLGHNDRSGEISSIRLQLRQQQVAMAEQKVAMAAQSDKLDQVLSILAPLAERATRIDAAVSTHLVGLSRVVEDAAKNGKFLPASLETFTAGEWLQNHHPRAVGNKTFYRSFCQTAHNFYRTSRGQEAPISEESAARYYTSSDDAILETAFDATFSRHPL